MRASNLVKSFGEVLLVMSLVNACSDGKDAVDSGTNTGSNDAGINGDAGLAGGDATIPGDPFADAMAADGAGGPRPTEPPRNLPPPVSPPSSAGVIVAVSHDLLISVSRDSGLTWTTLSHQPGLIENQMLLMRASYANGMYFATGWRFFSSADATSFTEVTLPIKQWFGEVAYGNGQYVSGGGWGSYLTSTDGVTWANKKLPGIDINITSVAFGGGRFAMALQDASVRISEDAQTWSIDPALQTTNVAYCDGAFKDGVACQQPDPAASLWQGHGYWFFSRWPDTLMRSSDGRTFTEVATFPAGIRDLGFGAQ